MDGKNYTVFIVDDSEVYRAMLVHAIGFFGRKEEGISVFDFPSGEKCLQYLHLQPDVIVLDHLLNGNGSLYSMDGLSVLSRIRKFSPGTDVVVVSGQRSEEVRRKFIRAGIRKYLQKETAGPFRIRELISAILGEREKERKRSEIFRYMAIAVASATLAGILLFWTI